MKYSNILRIKIKSVYVKDFFNFYKSQTQEGGAFTW